MRGDILRIIFDIIVLIVLAVLIYFIITALIGLAYGKELTYIGYLNAIADDINSGGHGQVFINNYDYNYVFVLTNNNGRYLQLYHCLPPNINVGLLSVATVYWNVSKTNNGDLVFAPALAFCKLVKQVPLNSKIYQIDISIQGLNDNAGLLALDFNDDNLNIFQISMALTNNFFQGENPFLAIINDTTITCDNNGCTFTSTIDENGNTYQESGNIYCDPNPNSNNNNNNNLPYNPSDCVELSGFPWNSQVVNSNLVGQIVTSEIYSLDQIFKIDFPLLYFAGSLPPTAMYIYINSNPNEGTANINIYIGETVSTSS